MGLVDGRSRWSQGAGRGQGRSHARAARRRGRGRDRRRHLRRHASRPSRLRRCRTEADLDETIKQIEAAGRRAVKVRGGRARRSPRCSRRSRPAWATLGKIDIVCANAGIGTWAVAWEMTEQQWSEMIDINLTGVFNTVRAALPSMVERGEGGSLVLTSSTAGLRAYAEHRALHGRQARRDRADARPRARLRVVRDPRQRGVPHVGARRRWSSTTRRSSCSPPTSRTRARTTFARRSRG